MDKKSKKAVGGRRGGARPGAGRKKGPEKKTVSRRTIAEKALENGLTPLDYMLDRLRDETEDKAVRLQCAKDAAPYIHPRLAAIEHSGPNKGPIEFDPAIPAEEAYHRAINP